MKDKTPRHLYILEVFILEIYYKISIVFMGISVSHSLA